MAIKFTPSNQKVELDRAAQDTKTWCLLKNIQSGIHRVEKQLEKITEEELDSDEQGLDL